MTHFLLVFQRSTVLQLVLALFSQDSIATAADRTTKPAAQPTTVADIDVARRPYDLRRVSV